MVGNKVNGFNAGQICYSHWRSSLHFTGFAICDIHYGKLISSRDINELEFMSDLR